VQQRVDHRILEMRPTPPGDELIGVAVPVFGLEEVDRDFPKSRLHVNDRPILIEHADLDDALERFGFGHRSFPQVVCRSEVELGHSISLAETMERDFRGGS